MAMFDYRRVYGILYRYCRLITHVYCNHDDNVTRVICLAYSELWLNMFNLGFWLTSPMVHARYNEIIEYFSSEEGNLTLLNGNERERVQRGAPANR